MNHEEILNLMHQITCLSRRHPAHGRNSPHRKPKSIFQRGRILIHLEKEDALTQKDLAERLHIRPQSLSELLKKLEGEGMIQRKPNEKDRRQILVTLSEQGRAHVDAVKEGRRSLAADLFAPLSEEEKELLGALLVKIIPKESPAPDKERPSV